MAKQREKRRIAQGGTAPSAAGRCPVTSTCTYWSHASLNDSHRGGQATRLVARLSTLHGDQEPTSPNTSVEVWRDLVHQYLSHLLPDGKRLVLVLDALDEAAWEVGPDLFPSVPPEVCVLVSARLLVGDTDATAWLCRLGWERQGRAYVQEVPTLSQEGLVEVLKSMGAPLDQLLGQWAIIRELVRLCIQSSTPGDLFL